MADRWTAPSGLGSVFGRSPRALPWASAGRAVGALHRAAQGATSPHDAPQQEFVSARLALSTWRPEGPIQWADPMVRAWRRSARGAQAPTVRSNAPLQWSAPVVHSTWSTPHGLLHMVHSTWVAPHGCPNGAKCDSPGQRPGSGVRKHSEPCRGALTPTQAARPRWWRTMTQAIGVRMPP